MKKRHIKGKYLLYALGMTVILLWLLFSTRIISKAVNGDIVKISDFETLLDTYMQDDVIMNADEFQYDGGMLDSFSVSGWALCDTEDDNTGRYSRIILRGEKCYELTPSIEVRFDVPGWVRNNFNKPEMKISNYTGFEGSFSLLDVEDGIYDIYLCCWENEKNHGIADTLFQIEKHGRDAQVYPWRGRKVEKLFEVTQKEEPVGYLDNISMDGQNIYIKDWEFVDGRDSITQRIIIDFSDDVGTRTQYTAKSVKRRDVADIYGSELYLYSGIVTRIPVSDFTDGTYTVRILVENEGEVWASRDYKMQIKEGTASKVE